MRGENCAIKYPVKAVTSAIFFLKRLAAVSKRSANWMNDRKSMSEVCLQNRKTEPRLQGQIKVATVPSTASLFRIPRVSAELKCSLETTKEKSQSDLLFRTATMFRELPTDHLHGSGRGAGSSDYLNQMKKPDSEEAGRIITTESTQTDDNARAETDRPVPFFLPGNDSPQGASMPVSRFHFQIQNRVCFRIIVCACERFPLGWFKMKPSGAKICDVVKESCKTRRPRRHDRRSGIGCAGLCAAFCFHPGQM